MRGKGIFCQGQGPFKYVIQWSQLPTLPAIDILLSGSNFYTYDTLEATAHITNGPDDIDVEVKVWTSVPDGSLVPIINLSTYTVPGDADFNIMVFTHQFSGGEPSGGYTLGGHFINPMTGDSMCRDEEAFSFTP